MTARSTSNRARPLVWIVLLLGIVGIAVPVVYSIGSLGDRFLSFSIVQILAFGVLFFVVGLGLLLFLRSAGNPARLVAFVVLGLGVIAVGAALIYTQAQIADNFFSFSLETVFWVGVLYIVIGLILLLTAGPARLEAPERPAQAVPRASASSPAPRATASIQPAPAAPKAPAPASVQPKPAPPAEPKVAPPAQVKSVSSTQPDDLEIIEGIGPKIAEALRQAGITTFAQIARMSASDLERIVRMEQKVPIVGDAATWARQAQYIVDGDVNGLHAYQQRLIGGREPGKGQ